MKPFRVSIYVGPTIVGLMAGKFRDAGLTGVREGTIRVWAVVHAPHRGQAQFLFLDQLRQKYGHTFQIRPHDVCVIKELTEPKWL